MRVIEQAVSRHFLPRSTSEIETEGGWMIPNCQGFPFQEHSSFDATNEGVRTRVACQCMFIDAVRCEAPSRPAGVN
jgi:hypothetical protein